METIKIKQGLRGFFKIVKHKGDADGNPIPGTEELVADWFENLITDNGKNAYASANNFFIEYCQVGTGNTAPSVGDTALVNRVAGTNANATANSVGGAQGAPPYYGWWRKTFRFGTGTAAGNLAEVGVSPYASPTGNLFSRALIVDGMGNPTTITVLSDEVLDVTYEFRVYPILTDLPGNIVLEAINRTTNLRAAQVTEALGNTSGGWAPSTNGDPRPLGSSGKSVYVYGGAATLGAITAAPIPGPGGGTIQYISAFGNNRITTQPYTPNTFYRDFVVGFGLNDANIALGIGAVFFGLQEGCAFQITFDPPLDKTNQKILSLTFRVYWDRFTPP